MTVPIPPRTGGPTPAARVSVVIPVHNEAEILHRELGRILTSCRLTGDDFEIVVCENGSTDDTWSLLEELQRRDGPEVRAERLPAANYGLALRRGIALARYETVVIFNIDFWDAGFLREAAGRLAESDVVIGSKTMPGSEDRRPLLRQAITRSFNGFLRLVFGFRGTDTHGMKALRRAAILDIAETCITDADLFDTELVLRAERRGLRIVEVPVRVAELRQPNYWSLCHRVPATVRNLIRLYVALNRSSR